MRRFRFYLLLLIAVLSCRFSVTAQSWTPDSLGAGFYKHYVDQVMDNGEAVRCTVINFTDSLNESSDRGVLYIHGYNDYFFQSEMAYEFASHGYRFFAVDLRRYGRSILPGQKPFLVKDFSEYYADVDSALAIMQRAGCREIVLMGHSTGGLVASCYMVSHPDAPVNALVLNSPFLDWNLGWKEKIVGLLSGLGKWFPNIPIDTGGGGVYEQSLSADSHGEWTFNHAWKGTSYGVNLAWVRAVTNAQRYLRKHPHSIHCPILLMYSSRSMDPKEWSPEASRADIVLDVKDIKKYGLELGTDVTAARVNGGMHDLILSAPDVRYPVYRYIFNWLSAHIDSTAK